MIARNSTTAIALDDSPAVGLHATGKTCVKRTTDGRFAVCSTTPNSDGQLRLIRILADSLMARRYNFAIHGDRLGE